jgi:hypothetical protein
LIPLLWEHFFDCMNGVLKAKESLTRYGLRHVPEVTLRELDVIIE